MSSAENAGDDKELFAFVSAVWRSCCGVLVEERPGIGRARLDCSTRTTSGAPSLDVIVVVRCGSYPEKVLVRVEVRG